MGFMGIFFKLWEHYGFYGFYGFYWFYGSGGCPAYGKKRCYSDHLQKNWNVPLNLNVKITIP